MAEELLDSAPLVIAALKRLVTQIMPVGAGGAMVATSRTIATGARQRRHAGGHPRLQGKAPAHVLAAGDRSQRYLGPQRGLCRACRRRRSAWPRPPGWRRDRVRWPRAALAMVRGRALAGPLAAVPGAVRPPLPGWSSAAAAWGRRSARRCAARGARWCRCSIRGWTRALRPDRGQPARRADRPQRRGHPHRAAPGDAGAPGRGRGAWRDRFAHCRVRWWRCWSAAATAGSGSDAAVGGAACRTSLPA